MNDNPIGFFDSGVGGLSVLKKAVELLPKENFIYFGDSKNAPYGTKTVTEVKELSFNAAEFLIKNGAKAIVVACNTATSAVIEDLREKYNHMPVIGIEPALKPAVELGRRGKVIIMATPMTLSERKFSNLLKSYEKEAEIEALPCAGLVELIENGIIDGEEMNSFLKDKLMKYNNSEIAAIVLGCTHYPFVKKELVNIVGDKVAMIDGSLGTANQLKRQLETFNCTASSKSSGKVQIFNSLEDEKIIDLSYKLLNL
jgi:glutamate racemase